MLDYREFDMKIINVILSGGVGSRLWPLSRKSTPKQYLEIFKDQSLFELSVKRNSKIADSVVVVGNIDNHLLSRDILSKVNVQYSSIVEATPRNTAAAIAFAAFACDPDDVLLITPSDHIITGDNEYIAAIEEAIKLSKSGYIVTFGIKPTRPETGYGYIEFSENSVVSFREKPSFEDAKSYLDKGSFLWNSGMFCFKASVFLDELKKYEPMLFDQAFLAWKKSKDGFLEFDSSIAIPSKSVDYAVMEKTKLLKVVPASFNWSDLGSFESLYDYLESQGHPVDAKGNMVIGSNIFTPIVGLENVIVVHSKDAVLVLNKFCSQEVKDVYSKLENQFPELID